MDDEIKELLQESLTQVAQEVRRGPEEREDTETEFVDDPELEGLPTHLIPSSEEGDD